MSLSSIEIIEHLEGSLGFVATLIKILLEALGIFTILTCSDPTDLTDAQWRKIAMLIPPAKPGGRPRTIDLREILNAIVYILCAGCARLHLLWRYPLIADLIPETRVYSFEDDLEDQLNALGWDGYLSRKMERHCS